MKVFDIYAHPVKSPQAVKQGFSWPAMFFGVFWLAYKMMWKWLAIIGGIIIVLSILSTVLPSTQQAQIATDLVCNLITLGLWILVGFRGNDWYRETMATRGFTKKGTFEAESKDDALAKAFQSSDDDDSSSTHHLEA
ncbi:DUF2628 domain-containing protein [Salinisphaera sp. Q1T1-3]|uniref:DUF2628 domain-containing protein n=1 Tax=Salinisphaera sp. Q1T1-3 TaxID=2321229 RepID=UPI000E74C011|nr:DUF2628 domain-containing protein [Salinisphaera sp. Q1T1-3]RJS91685.1 DUF2628 domain-containing protein [Salinisphaera sp. Q1T1-3]